MIFMDFIERVEWCKEKMEVDPFFRICMYLLAFFLGIMLITLGALLSFLPLVIIGAIGWALIPVDIIARIRRNRFRW